MTFFACLCSTLIAGVGCFWIGYHSGVSDERERCMNLVDKWRDQTDARHKAQSRWMETIETTEKWP